MTLELKDRRAWANTLEDEYQERLRQEQLNATTDSERDKDAVEDAPNADNRHFPDAEGKDR